MLVNIQNNIIDITKIIAITKVSSSYSSNESDYADICGFKIIFDGKKNIKIKEYHSWKEDSIKEAKEKCNSIRNQLIELWNKNKQQIMVIEP